jgi:pyrimidine-nucleoside phosphorylase|tara:strand:+ start:557 stop:1843 length:1287 start_codon:yes stop_codon:yes gene_type:complete
MNPKTLIQHKSDGQEISKSDLTFFISSYLNNSIDDNDMILFLKAVHKNGMTTDETFAFTEVMIDSGEKIEFSNMDNYVVDKHSTGGVGDKVSIILAPLMAASGLAIPMIAGRSLGHTGGTIDKLETIPNMNLSLTINQFKSNVQNHGISIMEQSSSICPADKKMYALRDITKTIDSTPLICGSIMSKKIAEGIQGLVLDIKTGNGAFMNTMDKAAKLGDALQNIGKNFNINTDIVFSSMDQPLGNTAGMWCEIEESIATLKGDGPKDLLHLTFQLGSKLLVQAGITKSETSAVSIQENLIQSGKAYQKFEEFINAQNGTTYNFMNVNKPRYEMIIKSDKSGYITGMDTLKIGWALVELGCGRKGKHDKLDPTAGIEFIVKIGDEIRPGEPMFRCFNSKKSKLDKAIRNLMNVMTIGPNKKSHQLFRNP